MSIFKDKYCEELAYPGIYCGERRVENSEREVPGYYSDVYVNQNLDIVTGGLLRALKIICQSEETSDENSPGEMSNCSL